MTWTPYVFHPHPPPDANYNYYLSIVAGYPVFKKVHITTGKTAYGFRADAIVWFETEQQIRKFLTV